VTSPILKVKKSQSTAFLNNNLTALSDDSIKQQVHESSGDFSLMQLLLKKQYSDATRDQHSQSNNFSDISTKQPNLNLEHQIGSNELLVCNQS